MLAIIAKFNRVTVKSDAREPYPVSIHILHDQVLREVKGENWIDFIQITANHDGKR